MKKKERLTQIIRREFDIKLFFYSGDSNANNLCGSYNIFINDKECVDSIFNLLEVFIFRIEEMRNKDNLKKSKVESLNIQETLNKIRGFF